MGGYSSFVVVLLFGVLVMALLGWFNPYVPATHRQLLYAVDRNHIEIPINRRYDKTVYMIFAIIFNVIMLIMIKWSSLMPEIKSYWNDILINIIISMIIQMTFMNISFYFERKRARRLQKYYYRYHGVKTRDGSYPKRRNNED